jgi:cation efflux family protein
MTEASCAEALHRACSLARMVHVLVERHRGGGRDRGGCDRRTHCCLLLSGQIASSKWPLRSACFVVFIERKPEPVRKSTARRSANALYVVAATFFAHAIYTAYESIPALLNRKAPETSMVGRVLSVVSLIIMPILAYAKQWTGREMGSGALQADAVETWVCSYLSLALLAGVGLHAAFGWWWADAVGALAMLPVILWQGWETLSEVREEAEGAAIDGI